MQLQLLLTGVISLLSPYCREVRMLHDGLWEVPKMIGFIQWVFRGPSLPDEVEATATFGKLLGLT